MSAYIARRIFLMLPTLLGILFVSFVVVQFAPGGPVERVIAQLNGADTGGTSRVSGGGGDFAAQRSQGGGGAGGGVGMALNGASLAGRFGVGLGGFGSGFMSGVSEAYLGANFVGPSAAHAGGSIGMGAQLGAAMPWLMGAFAIAALWGPLFGRKLKDAGIEGTFGGETGFEGRSYKFYEGGLFRSDKTEYDALDEKVRKGLADTFIGMRQQVSDFADALGLSTDRLKDYVGSIKVSTFGLSDAEAQKKFEEALATANNELAEQVIGTWETTAREVQRRIQSTNIEMEGGADQYRTETVTENTSTYTPSQFAR